MNRSKRILHVDASQGASGDMILGALVALGAPADGIREALSGLPLPGFRLAVRRVVRCALAATKVDVEIGEHEHGRGWAEIQSVLSAGRLPEAVIERCSTVFRRLLEAEAEVHAKTPGEVHLHEAGGTDAIVDVVGSCVAIASLGIDEIVVSRMTTGFGEVRCAHGVYPIPAPATALLVRGAPVLGGSIEGERLTPTGAALLTTLADRWGALPALRPVAVGYGAGSRDMGDVPNMLRMILGEEEPRPRSATTSEVAVLECTVDDSTPQEIAFAARRLLDAGALDVMTTPVLMKKERAGHHLTVLARPEALVDLARLAFLETSTLGLRFRMENRFELEREILRVETPYGEIEVKVGRLEGRTVQVWPEYETCAGLARQHDVRLREVQRAAIEAYRTGPGSEEGRKE